MMKKARRGVVPRIMREKVWWRAVIRDSNVSSHQDTKPGPKVIPECGVMSMQWTAPIQSPEKTKTNSDCGCQSSSSRRYCFTHHKDEFRVIGSLWTSNPRSCRCDTGLSGAGGSVSQNSSRTFVGLSRGMESARDIFSHGVCQWHGCRAFLAESIIGGLVSSSSDDSNDRRNHQTQDHYQYYGFDE